MPFQPPKLYHAKILEIQIKLSTFWTKTNVKGEDDNSANADLEGKSFGCFPSTRRRRRGGLPPFRGHRKKVANLELPKEKMVRSFDVDVKLIWRGMVTVKNDGNPDDLEPIIYY